MTKYVASTTTVLLLVLVCLGSALFSTAAFGATFNYGNFTLGPPPYAIALVAPWDWDLTQGDLTLSYKIDMSGITQNGPWLAEVGMRQVGGGNFDPGGMGGWMNSRVGDLTATPNVKSNMDKHHLGASGGVNETAYDATPPNAIQPPFGSFNNYGIWFDRDGVDAIQAGFWGAGNGTTYNTQGIYDVVIKYHAINPGLGTMFSKVNGVQTGFGQHDHAQPDIYPAGLSFTGDMANMQAFAGLHGPVGVERQVLLTDVTVTGMPSCHPVPEPVSVVLGMLGLCSVAGLKRLRR